LTEFCSTTKSVFPPWLIPPQTWTEPPPAMTVPTKQSSQNRSHVCSAGALRYADPFNDLCLMICANRDGVCGHNSIVAMA
jgi:hypothetical protein